jgi:diguanylate cyclase (GGDEF)-like protein
MRPKLELRGREDAARDRRITVIGFATIALLAFAQTRLPAALPLALVFVIPVVGVASAGGLRTGLLAGGLAASLRLTVELFAGAPVSMAWLGFAIALTVFSLVAWSAASLVARAANEREMALTDALTSLGNRRFFQEVAQFELSRSRRYRRPLSLAYIDVDRFKQVNDTHGHEAGDGLLRLIALEATGALRTSDVVARVGGDEFALLLPETPLGGAEVALEKLRERLTAAAASAGFDVGFSIGVVGCDGGEASFDELLHAADAMMYAAKKERHAALQQRA